MEHAELVVYLSCKEIDFLLNVLAQRLEPLLKKADSVLQGTDSVLQAGDSLLKAGTLCSRPASLCSRPATCCSSRSTRQIRDLVLQLPYLSFDPDVGLPHLLYVGHHLRQLLADGVEHLSTRILRLLSDTEAGRRDCGPYLVRRAPARSSRGSGKYANL